MGKDVILDKIKTLIEGMTVFKNDQRITITKVRDILL